MILAFVIALAAGYDDHGSQMYATAIESQAAHSTRCEVLIPEDCMPPTYIVVRVQDWVATPVDPPDRAMEPDPGISSSAGSRPRTQGMHS